MKSFTEGVRRRRRRRIMPERTSVRRCMWMPTAPVWPHRCVSVRHCDTASVSVAAEWMCDVRVEGNKKWNVFTNCCSREHQLIGECSMRDSGMSRKCKRDTLFVFRKLRETKWDGFRWLSRTCFFFLSLVVHVRFCTYLIMSELWMFLTQCCVHVWMIRFEFGHTLYGASEMAENGIFFSHRLKLQFSSRIKI